MTKTHYLLRVYSIVILNEDKMKTDIVMIVQVVIFLSYVNTYTHLLFQPPTAYIILLQPVLLMRPGIGRNLRNYLRSSTCYTLL